MDRTQMDALVTKFRNGELSRRGFIRQATALGISAGAAGMLAGTVVAQDATPGASPAASPVATPVPGSVVSIAPPTREEVLASIQEEFDITAPEQEGGLVIYGETTDIQTVNQLLSADVYSSRVGGLIYEYLIASSPVDGSFVPGLANTWEIAEDGRTYTFELNQDAMWQDGTPFTAADVIFSFDATLAEDSLSVRRATVNEVLESYTAVDDYTVELVANDLWAPIVFLSNTVGSVAIMPKHIWESVPFADWGTDPASTGQDPSRIVGTGPFTFVEWVTEDHVTLSKWPEYWDQPWVPIIDEFTYRVIPEASAATQALLTGEIDFADVGFAEAPELEGREDVHVRAFDTTSVNWYALNQDPSKTELFTDAKVRQALMYALDRNLLAEQVYNGYAIQANGTQPVLSIAFDPEATNTVYDYNIELAQELLEEAGWTDSDGDGVRDKDGVPFSFEFLFSEGVAQYEQQVPYMQQAWAEVGVEMIPTEVPFQTLSDAVDTGNFEMALFGFQWDIDGSQLAMFGCEYVPPAGFNYMRFCNEEYDALAVNADKILNPEERKDALIEASNILNDQQAAGYLVFRQTTTGIRNTLHNFYPNGYSYMWSIPFVWTEVQ